MLEAKPLPKRFFEAAKKMGVQTITISFEGGSDNGYVNTSLTDSGGHLKCYESEFSDLCMEIEDWAREAYKYSGAGDGTDYGDDITYDLLNGEVRVSEWYMARQDGGSATLGLSIEGSEEQARQS